MYDERTVANMRDIMRVMRSVFPGFFCLLLLIVALFVFVLAVGSGGIDL